MTQGLRHQFMIFGDRLALKEVLLSVLKRLDIRGDVVEHPCVADVVEAATDVALKNPLCTVPIGKRTEALLDGIGG